MIAVLFVIHILICSVLVAVVLLQAGRGGGLSGAFGGGGGGQALFGGRGAATFLNKATVVLGGLFFMTSVFLAMISARGTGTRRSLIQQEAGRARTEAPGPMPGAQGAQGRPGVPGTAQPGASQPAPSPSGQSPAAPGGSAPASKPAPSSP